MVPPMTDESGFQLAGSAPRNYERYVSTVMTPFVQLILDETGLAPAGSVLDLACGTGFAARAAAAHVGPAGRIVGVDINEDMLAAAATAPAPAHPRIIWQRAAADALPYADATFDAVLCQQGAQFFPDLDAALAEAARVTRPGGRIAATVWASMSQSPYFQATHQAIGALAGREAADSYAAVFACTPDRLTAAFRTAGLRHTTARVVSADIALPRLADFAPGFLSALPWGRTLAEAHPDGLARAAQAICRTLAPRTAPDGTTSLPFTTTLVTGAR